MLTYFSLLVVHESSSNLATACIIRRHAIYQCPSLDYDGVKGRGFSWGDGEQAALAYDSEDPQCGELIRPFA